MYRSRDAESNGVISIENVLSFVAKEKRYGKCCGDEYKCRT